MSVLLQGDGGRCFSRAEPRHKQDIVRLLKEMGEVSRLLRPTALHAPAVCCRRLCCTFCMSSFRPASCLAHADWAPSLTSPTRSPCSCWPLTQA